METKLEKKKTRAHYIDNKEFLKQISEYRLTVLAAKEKGVDKPPVTGYLGECFIKIANHLAYKSNFINYTFRDEMILDGIENCLTYIDNFDPAKSSNPFAYFTQITYYAFLRRIQKEKRQMDTKMKYLQSVDLEGLIADAEGSGEGSNDFLDWMRQQLDLTAQDNAKIEAQTSKNIPKRRPKYLDKKRSDEEEKALDNQSK
jgi:DNA-directed RNA polymerase specialized sigma24 family protein